MKALVAYFSAGGVTAGLARRLAEAIHAPVYEIRPAEPYTQADLDWRDKQSRSTIEMLDKNCRAHLSRQIVPVVFDFTTILLLSVEDKFFMILSWHLFTIMNSAFC